MKLKEHNILLEEIFQKVTDIRLAGQKEYAHDIDNCFANFERIANLQELKREQVLMTYLLKHIDGIQSYVKGHHSQREDVTGRIVDVIVYLTLLWGMVDHEEELVEMLERQEIDEQVSAERQLSKTKIKSEWSINEPTIEERASKMLKLEEEAESDDGKNA